MKRNQLNDLVKLGKWMSSHPDELSLAKLQSQRENPWFTEEQMDAAIQAISSRFLSEKELEKWLKKSKIGTEEPKNVGLIMAGNLPLVGFHDWLSVFVSGHKAIVKLSSKDKFLLPALLEYLHSLDASWEKQTVFVDKLKNLDAIVATGSDNSNRYFSYYFGNIPHIFRSHRNGVAVIPSDVSQEELERLGEDVFSYFGLGCRSVSLCMVPQGFDKDRLLSAWEKFNHFRQHSKWDHNFRYNYATLLLNQEAFLTNDVIILRDSPDIASRIACLHLLSYQNEKECATFISHHRDKIQVVVGRKGHITDIGVEFGKSQQPGLSDYADHVDTLSFLNSL